MIGFIPHNGVYPFYTNTHDHKYQVIVRYHHEGCYECTPRIGF